MPESSLDSQPQPGLFALGPAVSHVAFERGARLRRPAEWPRRPPRLTPLLSHGLEFREDFLRNFHASLVDVADVDRRLAAPFELALVTEEELRLRVDLDPGCRVAR